MEERKSYYDESLVIPSKGGRTEPRDRQMAQCLVSSDEGAEQPSSFKGKRFLNYATLNSKYKTIGVVASSR